MYFVQIQPNGDRAIVLRTPKGLQKPKTATVEGTRHNLIKARPAHEMHALCRTLNEKRDAALRTPASLAG